MANRYSQYASGANYSPESFKDLAVVPIALRQRHDAALAAQDDLLLQLNNIQVRDEDKEYYNQKREEINTQVETLTNKINTNGAGDTNLMGEFRNMKRAYNKEVSLAGGLGQAANIKQRIDSTRASYLDYATKQGFSPETGEANFKLKYNEWKDKNPSSKLGEENFSFGEFNPTFAPKQVDPVNQLKEIQPLIGEISKEEAFQNYKPVQDPNTGQITYIQYGGSSLSKSNLERLKSVESFINQRLMNPDSDLRQSLRYSRPGVPESEVIQQFITESDFLIDAMGVSAQRKTTQLEAPNFPKPTTGGSDKSTEEASLVSTPTGAEVFEGKSITDILSGNNIKQFEELENKGPLTEEQSNQKQLAIMQNYRVQEALQNPNTIRDVNNYLKENGDLTKNGIPSTIDGYKKTIEANEKLIREYLNKDTIKEMRRRQGLTDTTKAGTYKGSEEQLSKDFNIYRNALQSTKKYKETLDEAFNTAIPKDDLKYSKFYTFGSGDTSNKAKEVFNKSANHYGVNTLTLVENSGGKFTLPGETKLYGNNNENELATLKESFATGQGSFEFNSVIDMGNTGSSQLVLNYKIGEGEKAKTGMISIDYDNKSPDSSVMDKWFIEMQKTLDTPGKAVIQSILDNKQLKELSVDNKEYETKGFSSSQSETIKRLSNTLNSSYKNSNEYKKNDYFGVKGREFNMVVDKNGFHTLMVKADKKSPASPIGVGDWLSKEFSKSYANKTLKKPNPLNSDDPNDKRAFITTLKDLSLLADNDMLQVAGNSSEFNKLKSEYISELNRNENNLNLQYQLSQQYYNSIKAMRIAHKNKKRLL